ncbi:hypothetical protein C7999DRAFT_10602 [Corynascus novoguineensis]|uniref:C3H1-type domain-containing protein n=1 Tax=Corynascus novoguineensis TaxID=1126955 RepID=A0AAN7D1I8_9PEZI|nr:hypothetical protein C7999DRAFT_10602 [Corynascus novoguineensis]
MEQSHGGQGIAGWDPSSFTGETWEHPFGAFDHGAGAESSYPNPDFLDGGGAINPQFSGGDNQSGLYRQFDLYGQAGPWTDHSQNNTTPFAQEPSLEQGFFSGEQRHPAEGNGTIDGRFAVDIQQGGEFPSQIHSNANQPVNSHQVFSSHGVASPSVSAPNGYHRGQNPQWQQQVPAGYGTPHQFDNPLSASQPSNLSPPVSNGSPSPFFSGHGPSPSAMPAYQAEVRQQAPVDSRQIQPQFAATPNAQLQQPVALQSPARKATPQQLPQQFSQQVYQQTIPRQQPSQQPAQPSVQQTVRQPVQNPTQQAVQQPAQQPSFHPALQTSGGQLVFPQQTLTQPPTAQPSQPSENYQTAGFKRSSTSEPQLAPTVAKKAKVSVPATVNPSPQPNQVQPQPASEPVCTIKHQDDSLLSEARGRSGARWLGVPNLVVGSAPVKLQKGTPTKRYVTLATKGGKNPLFSKLWRAWTPAESLGNHADAYQKATNDLDRQRADIRLDIEMNRGNSEIPVDWFKKGLKDRLGTEVSYGPNVVIFVDCTLTLIALKKTKRLDPPPEPVYSAIKAVEYLRLHPAHLRNQKVAGDVCSDFAAFLQAKATNLKAALLAAAEKPKSSQAEAKAGAAKEQLERAIEEGLRVEPGNLFAKLSANNKMIAVLNNVLVRLINAGEANTSLAKAILRLNTRFTEVTSEQLEMLQMDKLKKKLGKEGDAEAKALINQFYDNAKKNDAAESDSGSDSPSTESGDRGKKAASAQGRVPTKQTTSGSDQKKTGTSSTAKSAISNADSRKISTASALSKSMASNNDTNKTASKATQKVLSNATGTKRSREDDSASADVRSSKKPATDNSSVGGAKAPSLPTKSLAASAGKTATSKPTAAATPGPAAAQTKSRSGLLLPGKARPAAKPAPKPEPIKAEAQKSAAKLESTLKSQSAKAQPTPAAGAASKAGKPKPGEATKEAPASKSIFSSLMKEIAEEEKTIKTPSTKKISTPDPNETPEERERRIRKERRRNLRVAFKSGDALVEVREFTRHPDEIAESNMARNVRIGGRDKNSEESEMMKRLHGGQGIKAVEINDREWEEPSAVDFDANISHEKREKTYITRGGLMDFETEEQRLTRERESKELMVIYHNRADIPPTPRSPPYEPSLSGSSGVSESHLSPATPGYDEIMQRGLECKQWGPYHASRAAQNRLETQSRPDYADFSKTLKSIHSIADSYNVQASRQSDARLQQSIAQPVHDPRLWYETTTAAQRDQKTFELLSSDRAKYWQDPDPYNRAMPHKVTKDELDNNPKLREVLDNLQRIVDLLKASQVEKPAQQEAPQQVGGSSQGAQVGASDYSAAWAQYFAAQQQHQQQVWYDQQNLYTQAANPYMQAQAASGAQQQQPSDPNNQYASILAALGLPQPAAQPQSQPIADQNSQIQAALVALAAGNQSQASTAPPADPQNTQYLLEMVKLATAGGQNQAQTAQSAYQQYYSQAAQGYSDQRPNQEREAYGQMYGGGSTEQARDRPRERDSNSTNNNNNNNNSGYGGSRGDRADYHRGNKGGRGGGNKNENVPEHLRGINRSLIGTKACAFWAKGQCAKGDKCTFRHD